MTPLSILLREEKQKRLNFNASLSTRRCRHEACINWAAGDRYVSGAIEHHIDLAWDEVGFCWKHIKEIRNRRAAQKSLTYSALVTQSPSRAVKNPTDQRSMAELREHFMSKYTCPIDVRTCAGLAAMIHCAISCKDDRDVFDYLLKPRPNTGRDNLLALSKALSNFRNTSGFLPLQAAVAARLDESLIFELYSCAPTQD